MYSLTFTKPELVAELTAKMLFEIEAVHFMSDKPFIFTSGKASPVYIDCRKIISFPRVRSTLMDFGAAKLAQDIGFEQFDAVAGGETAGIPFAAFIAERLNLPMQYIRKKPKGFGRDARIEGDIKKGQRILLVEDLTTDGGSKLSFAEAIREAGAEVKHTFVVFYYDIFKDTIEKLKEKDLALHYLATWWDVLNYAKKTSKFDNKTLSSVEDYLNNPIDWSNKNGGK
ncbi:MAG: orotate phosphoribosyltransferase [Proteobacteria bacterium]|jgi:orotate phosphoribosyltransferase|nr:orotate phosphoribosyltransferase [Pseudomonadota bacterium]MDA1135157.1 orotate phosphoribosyltransferase [Pseudomonadota bacterium]